MNNGKKWPYHMTRRQFLRRYGIASGAITLSPFFIERFASVCQAATALTRVYKVMNGDCFQNTAKLWNMLDGPAKYIGPNDIVVIKGNAQWPNQGYTHTGCIKGVIDQILGIPGYSGEILICDNVQTNNVTGATGFDATNGTNGTTNNRVNNWSTYNWNQLAASYQSLGNPVATVQWKTDTTWRTPPSQLPGWSTWNPANGVPASGTAWSRYFLNYNGRPTFLSYPVFQSPLTSGRMIDMQNGVWQNGSYTGQKVKTIVMPTLNNHGTGSQDAAGVTSAVKSFFGATEMSPVYGSLWNGYADAHYSSFAQGSAQCIGQLVGLYINTMYTPILYITAAMWSGWYSRTSLTGAAATNTVLACEEPGLAGLHFVPGCDFKGGFPAAHMAGPLDPKQQHLAPVVGLQQPGDRHGEPGADGDYHVRLQ